MIPTGFDALFESAFGPQFCSYGTDFGPQDHEVAPCEKLAEAQINVTGCPEDEDITLYVCLEHFNEVTEKLDEVRAEENDD